MANDRLVKRQAASQKQLKYFGLRQGFGRSNKRYVRAGLLVASLFLFAAIGVFVAKNPSVGSSKLSSLNAAGVNDEELSNPLDSLSSADIAVHVARVVSLPEATAVTNAADSASAQLAVASTDDNVITKPQVVGEVLKSRKDIIFYKVAKGDTVSSVAQKFGITSDTIRLSNNIAGDSLVEGTQIVISPVNGLVYRVQPGDTPQSLAGKYRASVDQLIAFNDAELTGSLKPGTLIVIPDGRQAAAAPHYNYVASSGGSFSFGGVGNYAYGWCTYYASARSGAPGGWGNAATWNIYAPLSGWTVSSIPRVGAIAQTTSNHVGIVEAVRVVDGRYQIQYSDMNGLAGWNRVGYSKDYLPDGGWVWANDPSHFQHYIYH